jgi:hypothetical protein
MFIKNEHSQGTHPVKVDLPFMSSADKDSGLKQTLNSSRICLSSALLDVLAARAAMALKRASPKASASISAFKRYLYAGHRIRCFVGCCVKTFNAGLSLRIHTAEVLLLIPGYNLIYDDVA